ncbi:unnamed protein product, partial [Didymodactylos carnosus]
ERVDTSIFCSSALKLPSRTVPDIQPNICTSPCIESPKDQINENQIIKQTNVNNNIKQTQQQIVKLADNLLNVADSDQDLIDKFTPPTIMTPTWVPSLRYPPLAPKRTNNRVGQQFEYDESSTSTSTTALVATITSHHRREWGIDKTLDNLFQTTSSVGKGVIVVGIDNGGSERLNELTPFSNSQYGGGQADKYLEFIIQKLKPYIDTHFQTKSERQHTVILGSSSGGLVSFYAAARYSHIFGRVGVFSPSFWFSDEIYRYAGAMCTLSDINPKLYFVCGGKESASTIPDMEKMIQLFIDNKKYTIDKNIKSVVKNDGEHSEWFWKREFVGAIQWLFND